MAINVEAQEASRVAKSGVYAVCKLVFGMLDRGLIDKERALTLIQKGYVAAEPLVERAYIDLKKNGLLDDDLPSV